MNLQKIKKIIIPIIRLILLTKNNFSNCFFRKYDYKYYLFHTKQRILSNFRLIISFLIIAFIPLMRKRIKMEILFLGALKIKSLDNNQLRKIILKISFLYLLPKSNLRNIYEMRFLYKFSGELKPLFDKSISKSILFSGQQYYHHWNLSLELRKYGWKSELYDWDTNPAAAKNYHGRDIYILEDLNNDVKLILEYYLQSIYKFSIFQFANIHGISFGYKFSSFIDAELGSLNEIRLLKKLGKKIIYTHTGCLDGVAQSSYNDDSKENVCLDCRWKNEPSVCSDSKNLAWGKLRNELSDYQFTFGASMEDFNNNKTIIETPFIGNINSDFWSPKNSKSLVKYKNSEKIYLYHTIANKELRTSKNNRNVKSSHIYIPLIEKFRKEKSLKIEIINPDGINNKKIKKYIYKADIVLDMLSFGWYGATTREALMLGKPVICYLNPRWLDRIGKIYPEFVQEIPIISATENNVEEKLLYLINNKEYRKELGIKSRKFAIKWHSTYKATKYFTKFYKSIL